MPSLKMMKRFYIPTFLFLFSLTALSSCTLTLPAEADPVSPNIQLAPTEALAVVEVIPNSGLSSTPIPVSESAQSASSNLVEMPDLGGRELTVATDNAYLPYTYILLGESEPAGWDHEMLDIICEMLNCKPVFVQAQWDDMIPGIVNGRYDLIGSGITITKDRAKIADFSTGYINVQQRIMVRADEKRFNTIEGLITSQEFLVGALENSTNFQAAKGLVGVARARSYPVFSDAIQALIDGEVDAVVLDETAGLGYFGHNADQVKLIGRPLTNSELGFIFAKRSDLVIPFNKALEQLKSDGTLDAMTAKYFTENFTVTYDDIGPGAYTEE